MSIRAVKHVNADENNRIEYLFVNFDYFDGNDLSAKILHEKYGITLGEKIDGMFYSIITLYDMNNEYKLIWHEDVGNYIYSQNQDKASIDRLKELVDVIIKELNMVIN